MSPLRSIPAPGSGRIPLALLAVNVLKPGVGMNVDLSRLDTHAIAADLAQLGVEDDLAWMPRQMKHDPEVSMILRLCVVGHEGIHHRLGLDQ